MLPKIENILYATDLSESARHAYKYAASLGQQYGARITILHVIEALSAESFLQIQGFVGEEKWKKLQEEKQADFISTIKGRLSNFCDEISKEVDACTFQVDKIIVKDDPGDGGQASRKELIDRTATRLSPLSNKHAELWLLLVPAQRQLFIDFLTVTVMWVYMPRPE